MRRSGDVARLLLHQIREQGLAPGTRIPSERALAVGLGVGRSTVREVLNGLGMLGALEIRHGQGTFVLDPNAGLGVPNTIGAVLARGGTHDMHEARRLVEVHTTRLAAERRTKHDVTEVHEIVNEQTSAISEQAPTGACAHRFRVRLAWASRNEVLARMVECFAELMAEGRSAIEASPGFREWELQEYRRVLTAVGDGHPERAAARMCAYLDSVAAWHGRLGASTQWHAPDR